MPETKPFLLLIHINARLDELRTEINNIKDQSIDCLIAKRYLLDEEEILAKLAKKYKSAQFQFELIKKQCPK